MLFLSIIIVNRLPITYIFHYTLHYAPQNWLQKFNSLIGCPKKEYDPSTEFSATVNQESYCTPKCSRCPNFRLFQHSPIDVATIQNFTRIRESLLSHMRKQVFHNGTVGKKKPEVLLEYIEKEIGNGVSEYTDFSLFAHDLSKLPLIPSNN